MSPSSRRYPVRSEGCCPDNVGKIQRTVSPRIQPCHRRVKIPFEYPSARMCVRTRRIVYRDSINSAGRKLLASTRSFALAPFSSPILRHWLRPRDFYRCCFGTEFRGSAETGSGSKHQESVSRMALFDRKMRLQSCDGYCHFTYWVSRKCDALCYLAVGFGRVYWSE